MSFFFLSLLGRSILIIISGVVGGLILNLAKIFPRKTGSVTMCARWDVPVGVPLDLSTPTGMSCIGT